MKWPWNHFTLLISYQRLTGIIETYLWWAASWNSGRWKPPSKPSNALSTAERRPQFAAKHHGIYEIPPFQSTQILIQSYTYNCTHTSWSIHTWTYLIKGIVWSYVVWLSGFAGHSAFSLIPFIQFQLSVGWRKTSKNVLIKREGYWVLRVKKYTLYRYIIPGVLALVQFLYLLLKRNILFAFGSLFELFLEKDVAKIVAFSLAAWNRQVSSNDYRSLDSLTKSIVKEKQPFVRLVITKEELLEMFKVIKLLMRATFASYSAILTSLALSCSLILLRTRSRLICFLYLNVQVLK